MDIGTLSFLKIDMRHWGPSIKGPRVGHYEQRHRTWCQQHRTCQDVRRVFIRTVACDKKIATLSFLIFDMKKTHWLCNLKDIVRTPTLQLKCELYLIDIMNLFWPLGNS